MNELDFREREASLCFVWSRMRVLDLRPLKAKVKLTQLSFEDFLEGLVRVSCLKTLPTQEQVFDAECEDAAEFILTMREKPDEYAAFVAANARSWDAMPDDGARSNVENICAVLLRTIEKAVRPGKKGELKQRDVSDFRRACLAKR